jgi:hypothetical protein
MKELAHIVAQIPYVVVTVQIAIVGFFAVCALLDLRKKNYQGWWLEVVIVFVLAFFFWILPHMLGW